MSRSTCRSGTFISALVGDVYKLGRHFLWSALLHDIRISVCLFLNVQGNIYSNGLNWKYPPYRNSDEWWSRGRAPDCQSSSIPPTAVSKLMQYTKSRWSLLSGVYARGSKRSHTRGKCVTCSEITNSSEEQLLR